MKITLEDLKEKNACYWEGKKHELADRVEANLPATLVDIMRWDWVPVSDRDWVFHQFPEAPLYQTYRDAEAPLWQAYLDAKAPLLQAYGDAQAPLCQAYLDAKAPLLQAYRDAKAELLKDMTK